VGIDREASAVRRSAERASGQGDADAELEAEQDAELDAYLVRLAKITDEQEAIEERLAAASPAALDRAIASLPPESDEDKQVDGDLERLLDLEDALESLHREHASLSGSGTIDRALKRLAEEVADGAED
jgi:hypothetical protein